MVFEKFGYPRKTFSMGTGINVSFWDIVTLYEKTLDFLVKVLDKYGKLRIITMLFAT